MQVVVFVSIVCLTGWGALPRVPVKVLPQTWVILHDSGILCCCFCCCSSSSSTCSMALVNISRKVSVEKVTTSLVYFRCVVTTCALTPSCGQFYGHKGKQCKQLKPCIWKVWWSCHVHLLQSPASFISTHGDELHLLQVRAVSWPHQLPGNYSAQPLSGPHIYKRGSLQHRHFFTIRVFLNSSPAVGLVKSLHLLFNWSMMLTLKCVSQHSAN
jgi:hypothetical protein